MLTRRLQVSSLLSSSSQQKNYYSRAVNSKLFNNNTTTNSSSSVFSSSILFSPKRFNSSSSSNNPSTPTIDPNVAEIESTIAGSSNYYQGGNSSNFIQPGSFQPPTPPNAAADAYTSAANYASADGSSGAAATREMFMSSSAASQQAVDAATALSNKPTLVSMVDSIWNSVAGVVSYVIPDFNPVLDFGVSCIVGAQVATGLPWSTVFFLSGVCVRLFTLYFTMYGERASLRLQVALPEIKKSYHRFELVYYDPAASQKEIMQVTNNLQEEQKRVYTKHGTSNMKAFTGMMSGPVFVYGFWVAMRTAGLAPGLSSASFAWVPSLTAPDPYCILPLAVVGATVLNFELFFAKKGGSKGVGVSSNLVGGVRLVALSCLWAISNFRASVLLYWAGVSLTGLLQPLLMRNPTFQKWWGVPTDDQMKRALDEVKQATAKAQEATVGRKTPTESFIEKLKETRQRAKSGVASPSASSASTQQQQKTGEEEAASYIKQDEEGEVTQQQQKEKKPTSAIPTYESFLKSGGTPQQTSSSSQQQQQKHHQPYRVLKATELEEKQKKDAEAAADDPMLQRFMMSMPMVSQSFVNPEKNQQLAEDIQNFNEKQMEEAQRKRSWKSKTK